ncbi:MAG: hypothetical protein K1X74_08755 [Pirellulales bacterium]|nr:hypothetical protein [Pirellulales bacterium]
MRLALSIAVACTAVIAGAAQAAEGTNRTAVRREAGPIRRTDVPAATPGQIGFDTVHRTGHTLQEDVAPGNSSEELMQPESSIDGEGGATFATDDPGGTSCGGACGCNLGGCCSGDCCSMEGCCELVGDCCGCFQPFGLAAGVEATYLKPDIKDDDSIDPIGEYDFEAAPRVWAQYQFQSGWGVRGRYWSLDGEQQRSIATADDEDQAVAQTYSNSLEMWTVDLELTRAFHVEQVNGWLYLGARHGRLRRDANILFSIFDFGGGGGDDASAILEQFDRSYEGTGLTFGVDLLRPIAQSRFAAVCNLRGAVLWGDNQANVNATVIEAVPVGAGDLDLNDFGMLQFAGSNNDAMWIGELQAGGEWNTPLSQAYGGGNAFVRVVFEAQWWNLPGVYLGSEAPEIDDALHQLLGVAASAGFRR